MQQDTKENLANRNIWARGLYMLFYGLAYAVAEAVATLVVVFQFIRQGQRATADFRCTVIHVRVSNPAVRHFQ